MLVFFSIDEYLPKPEIPKKELKWEDDLELRSKFIDRRVSKEKNTISFSPYVKIIAKFFNYTSIF